MRISVLRSGSDASGLSRYLFGKGRANEHTNPHLVAGSPGLEMEFSGPLSLADASILGRVVESAWRKEYVEQLAVAGGAPRGGISRAQLHREGEVATGRDHVFHASMSLPPTHESLTDEQWHTLAHEYVKRAGFVDENGHGSAWYAARHGESANGNDHIHIVVNLVRRDGDEKWASVHQSKNTADRIGRELEQEFSAFLEPTYEKPAQSADRQPGFSAYTQAEQRRGNERAAANAADAANGIPANRPIDADRVHLQRVLRGTATGSNTEAEWLRNAAMVGLELVPRWAKGGRDQVTGYSAGLADGDPADRLMIAASKIAPDLTLTSLRKQWGAHETPETRAEALRLWREEEVVTDHEPVNASEHLAEAAHHTEQFAREVETADPHDIEQWRSHAASAAGMTALAAVHHPDPQDAAQLGKVADEYARVSFDPRPRDVTTRTGFEHGSTIRRSRSAGLAARHLNLAIRAGGHDSTRGWYAVMKQLQRVMNALNDAQRARQELVDAHRGAAVLQTQLQPVLVAAGTHNVVAEDHTPEVVTVTPPTPPDGVTPEQWQEALEAQRDASHGRTGPAPQGPGRTDLTRPRRSARDGADRGYERD